MRLSPKEQDFYDFYWYTMETPMDKFWYFVYELLKFVCVWWVIIMFGASVYSNNEISKQNKEIYNKKMWIVKVEPLSLEERIQKVSNNMNSYVEKIEGGEYDELNVKNPYQIMWIETPLDYISE